MELYDFFLEALVKGVLGLFPFLSIFLKLFVPGVLVIVPIIIINHHHPEGIFPME